MKPGEMKYPHIFQPGNIGKMEVKNRIKYASTETNFNYGDGYVSDKEVAYMEAQARGGAGMVTTQGAYTDPRGEGQGYVGMMGIWHDRYIPGLKRISNIIHEHGAKAVLQLMHCGRVGGINLEYTVGPSVVKQRIPRFREPVEMTREHIEIAIEEHVQGARRCMEAGFDAVEISGIVGYLISNFISSYTNLRTDEYGGDVKGRSKFMKDIVEGIRKEVGPDYPIIIRLCADELLHDRGGNTPEESLEVIKLAEKAGADCLSVTAGWQESAVSVISRDCKMGQWLYLAKRVREALKPETKVSMAYRLFLPEHPEEALAKGDLDFWEMCRPMIADPFLPTKIAEDRQDEIIPCMACNICLARLFRDAELNCMVRPSLGHESEPEWGFYGFPKVEHPKKVWIIGAGLAGLQAAGIAAEKGHRVTVTEKKDQVGGQSAIASNGPHGDEEFMRLVNYLKNYCDRGNVTFEMSKEVTKADIEKSDADTIIIATGAVPKSDLPGADGKHVVSCLDVMEGTVNPGRCVVILGSKGVAISTALYLLEKGGHEISLVHPGKKPGADVNPSYIWRYMSKLKEGNVNLVRHSKPQEITDKGVLVKTPEGEKLIEADTVILADMYSVNDLREAKKGVYMIGDAMIPRRGNSAILDGYKMGMRL
ncbi:MAG: FAD-dependent oxidoreductase [Candidatus Latescibacteria bacterium]|nr:FAD-dependent oxidoreductase [Candidatus Latescibacterota bacterium]NIM64465.1 FAD-dependent oxidoreductase [Candidatus Latescibacterota bacterium]NIO00618.1 FAD-dependent oxidoreductase [Candidatus Latescibacterota bacterium]NIO27019.1 FAD-dependent oxidoreductase [Candidatus Latescibacterota bacterium]NIO56096.1 FAD-dependent oxidoreductase [Candidatus Latescibacterota bacterium]